MQSVFSQKISLNCPKILQIMTPVTLSKKLSDFPTCVKLRVGSDPDLEGHQNRKSETDLHQDDADPQPCSLQ
jgi:hypothetical protein